MSSTKLVSCTLCKMLYLLRQDHLYQNLVSWTTCGIQNGLSCLPTPVLCYSWDSYKASKWMGVNGKPCSCMQYINKPYILLWSMRIRIRYYISRVLCLNVQWSLHDKIIITIVPSLLVATGIDLWSGFIGWCLQTHFLAYTFVLWWCLYTIMVGYQKITVLSISDPFSSDGPSWRDFADHWIHESMFSL